MSFIDYALIAETTRRTLVHYTVWGYRTDFSCLGNMKAELRLLAAGGAAAAGAATS